MVKELKLYVGHFNNVSVDQQDIEVQNQKIEELFYEGATRKFIFTIDSEQIPIDLGVAINMEMGRILRPRDFRFVFLLDMQDLRLANSISKYFDEEDQVSANYLDEKNKDELAILIIGILNKITIDKKTLLNYKELLKYIKVKELPYEFTISDMEKINFDMMFSIHNTYSDDENYIQLQEIVTSGVYIPEEQEGLLEAYRLQVEKDVYEDMLFKTQEREPDVFGELQVNGKRILN